MSLNDKRVGLTGTLDGMSRKEFREALKAADAQYSATLDEDVHYLVVGERPLASRVEQAEALGVPTLNKAEFDRLLAGGEVEASSDDDLAEEAVPLAFDTEGDAPESVALLDDGRRVRVLDTSLPRNGVGDAPELSEFAHYALDARTLQMLRFIAKAVALGQPCLIEGDTATSKTSAIQYLAALVGQRVVRINLNGQSDTSELVGRYVPNDEEAPLPVEQLLKHLHLLEDESRRILEEARDQARDLTSVEVQQITANERIRTPAWRFHQGLVPQAMRHGWWIILDEVNLAEPAVLERMNSVLERQPTLVLTEGPGTSFGPGGDVEVHNNFRVFATMNPAEYQGRSILSPAYKDRWTATYQAFAPGETEYRQMLERLVFGTQPSVLVDNLPYVGQPSGQGTHHNLAGVPGIGGFLGRLAALHAGLVAMASPGEGRGAALGASRRERYIFSRRGLLAVLDALSTLSLCDPATGREVRFADAPEAIAADALHRVYVERVRDPEDREKVRNVLNGLGLDRDNWRYRFVGVKAD